MATSTHSPAATLALTVAPDPKRVPVVRTALRRWLLLHHVDRKARVVELAMSELLARAVIHARSDLVITACDDDGVVRIEVSGDMTPEPQRLQSVAELAGRRGEAILSAVTRDHGIIRDRTHETLWCEVWVGHSGKG